MTIQKKHAKANQHVEAITSDVVFGAFLYLTLFITGSYLAWVILFA